MGVVGNRTPNPNCPLPPCLAHCNVASAMKICHVRDRIDAVLRRSRTCLDGTAPSTARRRYVKSVTETLYIQFGSSQFKGGVG